MTVTGDNKTATGQNTTETSPIMTIISHKLLLVRYAWVIGKGWKGIYLYLIIDPMKKKSVTIFSDQLLAYAVVCIDKPSTYFYMRMTRIATPKKTSE